jgi:hypothetical protein
MTRILSALVGRMRQASTIPRVSSSRETCARLIAARVYVPLMTSIRQTPHPPPRHPTAMSLRPSAAMATSTGFSASHGKLASVPSMLTGYRIAKGIPPIEVPTHCQRSRLYARWTRPPRRRGNPGLRLAPMHLFCDEKSSASSTGIRASSATERVRPATRGETVLRTVRSIPRGEETA